MKEISLQILNYKATVLKNILTLAQEYNTIVQKWEHYNSFLTVSPAMVIHYDKSILKSQWGKNNSFNK